MRIWHQSFADLKTLPIYADRLGLHASQIVASETRVDVHGMPATAPTPAVRYPCVEYVMHKAILDAVSDAERMGYDAVTLGCFNDPVLREARSLVDIPVLGLAETALLVGCFYGRRLGLVTTCSSEAEAARELVEGYGLSARVAAYVTLAPEYSEDDLEEIGDTWPESLLDSVERAYSKCIELGAEVVVPAEGVLNEWLVAATWEGLEPAALVDAMGLLWKQAEALVDQRRSLNMTVSRQRYYRKPAGREAEQFRMLFGSADVPAH